MKRAILDTNVISECNITAQNLSNILKEKNLMPVIGIYTTYEIARPIITNKPHIASQLYSFIRDLNPEFSCPRDELYFREAQKLKLGESVNDKPTNQYQIHLKQRIDDFSNGIFEQFKNFIHARQNSLKIALQNWKSSKNRAYFKKYKNNFTQFRTDFFSNLESDPNKIEYVRNIVFNASEKKIILNDKEIKKIIHNKSEYPAIRTLIYGQLYLQFLTETNLARPSEDRFTDTILMIEGSYCDAIISGDKKFMHLHAKNINPYIETIHLKQLLDKQKNSD